MDKLPKKEKAILIILVLLFLTLGIGVGYLWGRDSNPAPIIIQKNSY